MENLSFWKIGISLRDEIDVAVRLICFYLMEERAR